ncbi:hypothetical protein A9995_10320 [Erythrobacter sp. QSSC1-22B]|nr:hypothetical protein A9995_10320 [Erythrobacter sp. QSSC1-22B]
MVTITKTESRGEFDYGALRRSDETEIRRLNAIETRERVNQAKAGLENVSAIPKGLVCFRGSEDYMPTITQIA